MSLPPVANDTSICTHLRALVERRRNTPPVKQEPGEANGTASPVKDNSARALAVRRYVQVVRWGAVDQGIKRRKVSRRRAAWGGTCAGRVSGVRALLWAGSKGWSAGRMATGGVR